MTLDQISRKDGVFPDESSMERASGEIDSMPGYSPLPPEELRRLRRSFLFGVDDHDGLKGFVSEITNDPSLLQGMKNELRFSVGKSGKANDDPKFIATLENAVNSFATSPDLPEWYTPSKIYEIRMLKTERAKSDFDEDATNKFHALRQDVNDALSIADSPESTRFNALFREGTEIITTERLRLVAIRQNMEQQKNKQALYGIDRKLEAIDAILSCDAKDFIRLSKDNFQILASLKLTPLDRLVRVGSFARAIRKSIATKYIAEHLPDGDPCFDGLVAVNGFVEHTIQKVDYRRYFSTDAAYEAFTRSINLSALKKQILKVQKSTPVGVAHLQFVPSRTLGLYFAGATGDACLDGSNKLLSRDYPNVTALTIFRNPGKTSERIVGSCLVMESKDANTGEDVLVLRAINPIVNFINSVSVDDFYNALMDYMRSIAGNKKVAVTIDSNGQASTNRPLVASYLEDVVKPNLADPTPLDLHGNTKFENYSLDDRHPAYSI